MNAPCPCCGEALSAPVYTVGPVPVHSCLMLETARTAAAFPTGMVHLAPCPACGFVTNTAFDPHWSAYAPNYEDQQSFSPTFNGFADTLARGLIERHGLSGKNVVEVGCSKGDFLWLLAERGGMRGVGIDPSAVAGRVSEPESGQIRLIPEYYSPAHLDIPADLLCCRHTLEHIYPVAGTLALMRRHMERNPGSVLCLEVPDATRIWRTGAFEDVYYEHCSYFTPGSLARALRRAGFALLDLRREYQDQYLVAEASLDPSRNRNFGIEESPGETAAEIAAFAGRVQARITGWQDRLEGTARSGKRVVIWGSGSKCVSFVKTLPAAASQALAGIIDINPHRTGKYAPGMTLPVSGPSALPELRPDIIVVMNPVYREEIAARCRQDGISAPLLPLG